ncbi:MAG TPA: hybrid sensor histidine kinase/response regulator, partial [Roseimicrobium sp.]|nr:hybrid sensor histidine kinase/response regulator [Roseimicrobium sp.]
MSGDDLSQFSMLDLFRVEAESQTSVLTAGLLALERNPRAPDQLEACMRAAHSLKGAGRIVNLEAAVQVSHAMEDCFVAAQNGLLILSQGHIDVLLRGVDLLGQLSKGSETPDPESLEKVRIFLESLAQTLQGKGDVGADQPVDPVSDSVSPVPVELAVRASGEPVPGEDAGLAQDASEETRERVLRVTAEHLNRLLGLSGENLVESRWLKPYGGALLRLNRDQYDLMQMIALLREALSSQPHSESLVRLIGDIQQRSSDIHQQLSQRLAELDVFDRRASSLAQRLYGEALACRMRPFRDGIKGFPRMVRDLGRALGKSVRLEISGDETHVDRDILERLEAPLGHLLRNALDHGLESPAERVAAGKPEECVIHLGARHSAGVLLVSVEDDGRGIDVEKVRAAVLRRRLTNKETAARLSEAELLEFLFLPGFSMKESVTEISGRGVGLDVVQTMVKEVRGKVRITSHHGRGTSFQLQLPLTLSVARTLLVEIAGEPYAFPLAYIVRTLKLARKDIELLEGRQHFRFEERQVGLVSAHQLLGGTGSSPVEEDVPVVVIGQSPNLYGLAVDRFLGERELVVQPLDPRLGKVKDISAGSLMEDGSPVLIVDVDDLLRSVEKLASGGQLQRLQRDDGGARGLQRKRVLVVDDSLTVRELERKLLEARGYEVEVAVDGVDGWNAVRAGNFSLVITDIDMPRM